MPETTDTTTESETEPSGFGERVGSSIAGFFGHALTGLTSPFVGFWKRMKGGVSVAEMLRVMSYKITLRRNGDAIVNVIYEDGVVKPQSATYNSDGPYFETASGDKFWAGGVGYNPRRMDGKVPIVWGMRVGSEITEPLETPIARARQLGNFQELDRADGERDIAVDIDPNSMANAKAVADGGNPHLDGLVVSFREGYELFGSKVTNEDMEKQETRGKLAALDFRQTDTWKWIIAIFVAFALGLFGPGLASQLGGAAAQGISGGGPSLPLLLGVLL